MDLDPTDTPMLIRDIGTDDITPSHWNINNTVRRERNDGYHTRLTRLYLDPQT
jgi:hypothetical protein